METAESKLRLEASHVFDSSETKSRCHEHNSSKNVEKLSLVKIVIMQFWDKKVLALQIQLQLTESKMGRCTQNSQM